MVVAGEVEGAIDDYAIALIEDAPCAVTSLDNSQSFGIHCSFAFAGGKHLVEKREETHAWEHSGNLLVVETYLAVNLPRLTLPCNREADFCHMGSLWPSP